jgi:multidrug efflux pump subunit AcrA (membrane-fusion protein)
MISSTKHALTIIFCGLLLAGFSGTTISCQPSRPEPPPAAVKKTIYHCPMHPTYLSEKPGTCPICAMDLVPVDTSFQTGNTTAVEESGGKAPDGMDLVPVYEVAESGNAAAIKIDPTTIQNMGVKTETVMARDLRKDFRASGTIELDETRVSVVNTKIMGWVEKLYIDYTGQALSKGQALLDIYSPDLVSAQEEYLQSLRFLSAASQGISPEGRRGAEQLVESGRRRLLNWDIPEEEITALEKRGTPKKALTIYSPSKGIVAEKMVVSGQNVMPGMPLYRIADISTVWAVAGIHEEDLPYVKIGAEAAIGIPSVRGRKFRGKIQFVPPMLDASTKTAAVRVAIENSPDLLLKPQMSAEVTIESPPLRGALSVSRQAVIHSGERTIVIVSLGNGLFRPQEVTLGMAAGPYVQILSGLREGLTVVTSSQFLIDSESNLRTAVGQMGGMENMPGMEGMEHNH